MPPRGGAARRALRGGGGGAARAGRRTRLARSPTWSPTKATRLDALRNAAEARRIHERAITTPAALAAEARGRGGRGPDRMGGGARGRRSRRLHAGARTARRSQAGRSRLPRRRPFALRRASRRIRAGAGAAEIDAVFSRLRAGLVDLRARIAETLATPPKFAGRYPARGAAGALPAARGRLRLRLGGGAAGPGGAPVLLGLARRRAHHNAHRGGRSAGVPLHHDP